MEGIYKTQSSLLSLINSLQRGGKMNDNSYSKIPEKHQLFALLVTPLDLNYKKSTMRRIWSKYGNLNSDYLFDL